MSTPIPLEKQHEYLDLAEGHFQIGLRAVNQLRVALSDIQTQAAPEIVAASTVPTINTEPDPAMTKKRLMDGTTIAGLVQSKVNQKTAGQLFHENLTANGITPTSVQEVDATIRNLVPPSKAQLLEKFAGPRNVFKQYLHSSVMVIGHGLIEPGHENFPQYDDNISQEHAGDVISWPNGFYYDAEKGVRQLLFKLDSSANISVFISDLQCFPEDIYILTETLGIEPKYYPLSDLEATMIAKVYQLIQITLLRLS